MALIHSTYMKIGPYIIVLLTESAARAFAQEIGKTIQTQSEIDAATNSLNQTLDSIQKALKEK